MVGRVHLAARAPTLNVDALFAGCLVEPEVDGPDALPDRVEWDLTGLVPLAEASARHPEAVAEAERELLERAARAAELFATPAYERFREAFTLPDLERHEHWFFDPAKRRLRVIRWGAQARGIEAKETRVYGPAELVEAVQAREAEAPRVEPRRRRWWVAAVALLVVGVGVAAIVIASEPAPEPEPESAPEPEPAPEPAPEPEPELEVVVVPGREPIPEVHRRIYFRVGSATLEDAQRESLEVVRAHLESHPRLEVLLVEGHADVRGRDADNLALSQRRALAVMRWLEERGVAPGRLRGSGCSARYHAAGASEEELRADRRVEVYILEPPPPDGVRRHEGCAPVSRQGR